MSDNNLRLRWAWRCYAILLVLVGAALLAGGIVLLRYGGSSYYVVAGLALGASGILIWRRNARGVWLYAALLVGSLSWAVGEVGADLWGLIARLAALVVLGLPLLTLTRSVRGWSQFSGAMLVALLLGAAFHTVGPSQPINPLFQHGRQAYSPGPLARPLAAISRSDWAQYGNDLGGTRFSPLTQINPQNVSQLKVAWEADTGPAIAGMSYAGLEVTPINVGDALYLCNAYNDLISLDAETGQERWRFNMTREAAPSGKPCRGVSYYRVPGATGLCAERILAPNQSGDLFAVDAVTGEPCPDFGEGGRVSLRQGLGKVPFGYYYTSSAPQILRGNAIVGAAVLDGQYWGEPSGVIRAFDAVTGRLAWAFDAGHPENRGAPSPGDV